MYRIIHNGNQYFVIETATNKAVFSAIYQRACINWINEKVGMINMINNWKV